MYEGREERSPKRMASQEKVGQDEVNEKLQKPVVNQEKFLRKEIVDLRLHKPAVSRELLQKEKSESVLHRAVCGTEKWRDDGKISESCSSSLLPTRSCQRGKENETELKDERRCKDEGKAKEEKELTDETKLREEYARNESRSREELWVKNEGRSREEIHIKESRPKKMQRRKVDVRMIDFAHTTHEGFRGDKIVHKGPDMGYILGLDNTIRMFQEIQEEMDNGNCNFG